VTGKKSGAHSQEDNHESINVIPSKYVTVVPSKHQYSGHHSSANKGINAHVNNQCQMQFQCQCNCQCPSRGQRDDSSEEEDSHEEVTKRPTTAKPPTTNRPTTASPTTPTSARPTSAPPAGIVNYSRFPRKRKS